MALFILQAHSSVEKAGLITLVKMRFLPTDEKFSLRGDTLKQAIKEDKELGLVPFMVGIRQHTDPSDSVMQYAGTIFNGTKSLLRIKLSNNGNELQ